tara:strand:- start:394 stop:1425 length:1032 start_codon:yes stop_codon:yes gene_type:complete
MSQTKAELVNGLSINAAADDAITVDSSGRVGIGTTSPDTILEVANGGTEPRLVRIHNSSTNGSAIQFTNTDTGNSTNQGYYLGLGASGDANVWHQSNFNLLFATNNTERMRIDSSGKVGIGTTSPSETMHVNGGDVLISHTAAPNVRIVSADNSSGSSTNRVFLGLATGSNNFMNGSAANDTCLVCSEGGNFLLSNGTSYKFQIAANGVMFSPQTYSNTTGNSANVSVPNSDGQFFRSTSSIKYKDNVATLTDTLADKILNCRPVSYTSKCSNDDKTKVFYGLIAEEVDKIDQSLVFYNNDSETPEPEGVQYDRFVPALINLVKRQKTQIETLETKVSALEAA